MFPWGLYRHDVTIRMQHTLQDRVTSKEIGFLPYLLGPTWGRKDTVHFYSFVSTICSREKSIQYHTGGSISYVMLFPLPKVQSNMLAVKRHNDLEIKDLFKESLENTASRRV